MRHAPQYRLPTEAEWDHAAHGGASTQFSFGDDPKYVDQYAVFRSSATSACGSKMPNGFGLFDMHGNVWEICQSGALRGGAFNYFQPQLIATASKHSGDGGTNCGFRVAHSSTTVSTKQAKATEGELSLERERTSQTLPRDLATTLRDREIREIATRNYLIDHDTALVVIRSDVEDLVVQSIRVLNVSGRGKWQVEQVLHNQTRRAALMTLNSTSLRGLLDAVIGIEFVERLPKPSIPIDAQGCRMVAGRLKKWGFIAVRARLPGDDRISLKGMSETRIVLDNGVEMLIFHSVTKLSLR